MTQHSAGWERRPKLEKSRQCEYRQGLKSISDVNARAAICSVRIANLEEMCLLIFVWKVHDNFALTVAANRDEQYARPAQSFTILQQQGPRIVGGRDLLAGGTWLAVNDFGVIAGLTNTPSPDGRDASKRSRGELPLMLTRFPTAAEGVQELTRNLRPGQYNAARLLVGDRTDLFYIEVAANDYAQVRSLQPGLHVLENVSLDAKSSKVRFVEEVLKAQMADEALLWQTLPNVLSSHAEVTSSENVLGNSEETRIGRDTRSPCIHSEEFGTRSALIIRLPTDVTRQPEILCAEGSPCTTPFLDVSSIWNAQIS